MHNLKKILSKIDGKGYKAYKALNGKYNFGKFILFIDYVQGDPFASPSRVRVRVESKLNNIPEDLFKNNIRKVAVEDYFLRNMHNNILKTIKNNRGTGKSGMIECQNFGQEILQRTGIKLNSNFIEARLNMGLPARGRRILSKEAEIMFFDELTEIVDRSLFYKNIDSDRVKLFADVMEDQEYIRNFLKENNYAAFIANNSFLPRKSGISDKPMSKEKTVPFKSPQDLEITIKMVNSGIISGMAISKGVTIIVGGGYHGKSTLLEAIEKGVYNHIPGDGREFVITDPSAFKIRAEDGRAINNVNISPFINNLPHKQNTERFSTENASGSTSQATNIIEAIELGSRVLLLDEDTSATNFMIRDERMQKLVSKEKEPITPFIDQVRNLFENKDVSSILVVGGTGDYFEAADRVIMMDEYIPKNLTKEAKKIISNYKSNRLNETKINFNNNFKRKPLAESFNPFRGKKIKVDIKGLHTVIFGNETINLNYLEQLTDLNQTKAIAHIIHYLGKKYYNGEISLEEGIDMLINDIEKEGFEIISPFKNQHPGFFAMPRKYEIGAAVNRMRSLNVIN